MFVKKLLPFLFIIPIIAGSAFQSSSASYLKNQFPNSSQAPTITVTVCAAGPPTCDFDNIQDAINDPTADFIQLSSEIYSESLTIDRDVSISGAGYENTIIQAATSQGIAASRVITVTNGISVSLAGATIRHGVAAGGGIDDFGGGILNQGRLTIQNSLITLNASEFGGGIANKTQSGLAATTTIMNSTILSNEAFSSGGGIFNETTQNGVTNAITLTQSTINNNQADLTGGGISNLAGNGIARFSSFNSTISDNFVDGTGGGLFNEVTNSGSALSDISQSTFSNNTGGNIYNVVGNIEISQSIVANTPGENSDCTNNGGLVTGDTFSLMEDGSCGFPQGGDPLLGILTNNGGDLETHSLQPGSQALDAIPPNQCESTTDQRTLTRPFGAGCDIGAFELDTIDLEIDLNVSDQNVIPGDIITFTLRLNPIGPGISSGVISYTVPAELYIHSPIQLDPSESGSIGEPPILAHSIIITANHGLTMTLEADISLGLPGGTNFENIFSFRSNEILTPVNNSVTINVNNASPVAVDDDGALFTTDPDKIFITGNVLDNDSDPNGDTIFIISTNTSNLKGILTPLGGGTFSYNPDGQFNDLGSGEFAEDTFTYRISDGSTGEAEATVTILIHKNTHEIFLPLLLKGQ